MSGVTGIQTLKLIKEHILLGCNAVWFEKGPTFWRNTSPPTSWWESRPNKKPARRRQQAE
jgi:hypothetical protein